MAILTAMQSQGLSLNSDQATWQQEILRETDIEGFWNNQPVSIHFSHNGFGVQWARSYSVHNVEEDVTALFYALVKLPGHWSFAKGRRLDFGLSVSGAPQYLDAPYPLMWIGSDWTARIGGGRILATPAASVESWGDGVLIVWNGGLSGEREEWAQWVKEVRDMWGREHFFVPQTRPQSGPSQTTQPLTPNLQAGLRHVIAALEDDGWIFSRDDLCSLDSQLDTTTSDEQRANAAIILGETIRRHASGSQWVLVLPWHMPGISGLPGPISTAIPRAKVDKRCDEGPENNLVAFFDLLVGHLTP